MLLTKISGLRDPEDIEAVGALGPAYMTFDFCPLSLRYIGEIDAALFSKIPPRVRRAGRFTDEHTLRIVAIAGKYGITTIELDGCETAAQCEQLSAEGLEIIKTIRPPDLININNYEGVCNRLIFKNLTPSDINNYIGKTPFLICNEQLKMVEHKLFCGVDCGEGLEHKIGCKDIEAVRAFLDFYKSK